MEGGMDGWIDVWIFINTNTENYVKFGHLTCLFLTLVLTCKN